MFQHEHIDLEGQWPGAVWYVLTGIMAGIAFALALYAACAALAAL